MPNNDYIKRGDIFPAVTEIAKEIVFGGQDDDKVVDIINSIPAADVEPKRKPGRWVGMQEYCQHLFDTTGERYTMSQLGIYLPHCDQCWKENESRTPFCPHCGAKMFPEPPKEAAQ